jgi:manganese/zinc/iron transport system substrate-binding protein
MGGLARPAPKQFHDPVQFLPPMNSLLRFLAISACFILTLSACSDPSPASNAEDRNSGAYDVVATTGMIGDIVRHVAGDAANVVVLIGPGTDPHIFVPSRDDLRVLASADIIFTNGLHLEGRMNDVLERLSSTRPVHPVTNLLPQEYLLLDEKGQATDPHVWMDVQGWIKATEAVAQALAEFDDKNADQYQTNAGDYIRQLEELDAYARQTLATIPAEQRILVTAHDAFRYMARAYEFDVHGIQGISTASEAGLLDINRLVDMIVLRRIPAVFPESTIADRNVRALVEGAASRGHQVKVGPYLFSDAMGTAGTYEGTYIGMIDHNVTSITRALGGEAPERGLHGKLGSP